MMKGKKIFPMKILLALTMVLALLALTPVPAFAAATATRTLPDEAVGVGAQFEVGIDADAFGAFGQVVETLPDGFTYVADSATAVSGIAEDTVAEAVDGQNVTFTFLCASPISFTYDVTAPDTAGGPFYFAGVLDGATADVDPIGGDTGITVSGPPPLPAGTAGVFYTSAIANSEDGICRLIIPAGTVGLTEELERLTIITMLIMDEPPTPPEYTHVIGLVYDFQPSGATFEPPITLKYSYDSADIPEGIAEEDLVIAYYDQKAGEWVNLEGTVDPGRNTITVLISHFTAFTILGYEVPEPAAFTPGSLVISPTEVDIGETVTISVSVSNTGTASGSYKVTLKIDGAVEATEELTLDAGASKEVTFTTSKDKAATYSVDINGLKGSFTVKEKPAPAPPAPPPEVKPPINWPVVGGVIVAVVVVGLLIFFLVVRRRAY